MENFELINPAMNHIASDKIQRLILWSFKWKYELINFISWYTIYLSRINIEVITRIMFKAKSGSN